MKSYLTIVLAIIALADCGQQKDEIFKCTGDVGSVDPLWTKENQKIALRVSDNVVEVSGNTLILTKTISICPAGTAGTGMDEVFFDSDGCGDHKTTPTRQYGTFNRILRTLSISNTNTTPPMLIIEGTFKCEPTH